MTWKILGPFVAVFLRVNFAAFSGGVLILLGARAFGCNEYAFVTYMIPLILSLITIGIVGTNFSWLISLPISKNGLMVLFLIANLFGGMICLLNYLSLALVHFLLFVNWETFRQEWPAIQRWVCKAMASGISVSPAAIAFLVFFLLIVPVACLPFRLQAVSSPAADPYTLQRQRRNALVVFVLILSLGFGYGLRFFSPMVISILLILGIPGWFVWLSVATVGFSARYRRIWRLGVLAIGLIGCSLVFGKAVHNAYFGANPSARYDGVAFLGLLSGQLRTSQVLESFLREDLKLDQALDAASSYSVAKNGFFHGDDRWWLDQSNSALSFADVINSKTEAASVAHVARIFKPESLLASDLEIYSLKMRQLLEKDFPRDHWQRHLDPFVWMHLDLPESKVVEMVKSEHGFEVEIALMFIRFHPSWKFLGAIEEAVRAGMPRGVAADTNYTLFSISDAPNSLEAQRRIIRREGNVFRLYETDCGNLDLKEKQEKPELRKARNHCLRKAALKSDLPAAYKISNADGRWDDRVLP